jgi:hypothetical protein
MSEKPGERPPASPSNDGRLLDGTLGSDPVHQDRPHHVGQTSWILDGADLIPKAVVRIVREGIRLRLLPRTNSVPKWSRASDRRVMEGLTVEE